jgi:hypothetical protein
MRYLYKDQSNRGGAALFVSSALVFLLLLLLLAVQPELAPAQAWLLLFILLLLAAAVAYHKMTAPQFHVECNEYGVIYHHRAGSWLLPWHAFAYAQVAELPEHGELAFVGFKVTALDSFLPHLPLRLAVRLIIEQRHLLLAALRQNCPTGHCPAEFLMETGPYHSQQRDYHGVQAMFAHRMQHCAQLLGLELFIPSHGLPVTAVEFCRQVNQSRLRYLKNTQT